MDSSVLEKLPQLSPFLGRNLFAVIDACDEPLVPDMVDRLGDRATCLYTGQSRVRYRGIAPYLVHVDDSVVQWIAAHLNPINWGFYLVSDAELADLRRHFKRFLFAELPSGDTVYFRFYDPRVLQTYLKNCSPTSRAEFLDKLTKLFVPIGKEEFIEVA